MMKDIWRKHRKKDNYNFVESRRGEKEVCNFNIFYYEGAIDRKLDYLEKNHRLVTIYEPEAKGSKYYCIQIESFNEIIDKNKNKMAFVTAHDWKFNAIEIKVFYDTYPEIVKYGGFKEDEYYLLHGHRQEGSIFVKHMGSKKSIIPLNSLKNI